VLQTFELLYFNSGFDREDEWGFRSMEPSRCCISSIALVLLKTGITHTPSPTGGDAQVTIDYEQMTTAQKLLLFWRKPAVSSHNYFAFEMIAYSVLSLAQMLVGRK
jgi:hypothetical protein